MVFKETIHHLQNSGRIWFTMQMILFLVSVTSWLNAQQISNIQVTQEGDNIIITYDITGGQSGQTFNVNVAVSSDKGSTLLISPINVTGDLKDVAAGYNKRIIWNVLSDGSDLVGDGFIFKLVANINNPVESFTDNSGIFTDKRDGEVYKWVKIGGQVWMAENLKATKYNNGASVPNSTDNKNWKKLIKGAYCLYDNELNNKAKYGLLYNWYAVNTGKICPLGWHVPTAKEWSELENYLGGSEVAGGKMELLTGWNNPTSVSTYSSGFSGLPGGYRDSNGYYDGVGHNGYWWSATEGNSYFAWSRYLLYSSSEFYRSFSHKSYGFSVRCLRD